MIMKTLYVLIALWVCSLGFPDQIRAREIPFSREIPDLYIHDLSDTIIRDWIIPGRKMTIKLDRRKLKCYMPPAFIVDRVHWPYERFSTLHPEDIARIEVLKCPCPWKEFGLPKNITGIILITTKKKP